MLLAPLPHLPTALLLLLGCPGQLCFEGLRASAIEEGWSLEPHSLVRKNSGEGGLGSNPLG